MEENRDNRGEKDDRGGRKKDGKRGIKWLQSGCLEERTEENKEIRLSNNELE